jgi:hypothetical protein
MWSSLLLPLIISLAECCQPGQQRHLRHNAAILKITRDELSIEKEKIFHSLADVVAHLKRTTQ